MSYYTQALPILKLIGNKSVEVKTLINLMVYWNESEKKHFAVFFGKQSIHLYEELRQNVKDLDKETQKTFLRSIEKAYRYLADILITQERFVEAQRILNLFKDQQFFDYNQNSNQSIKQIIQSPRESENAVRYQQTSEQIGIIGQQIEDLKKIIGISRPTTEQTTQMQKLEQSLKSATDDFFNFLKQAEVDFSKPADAKDKTGEIPDTREMQTALRNLNKQTGQKTVAIYTLVGKIIFAL